MTKEEILKRVKDNVAKDNMFVDWEDLLFNFNDMDKYVDIVSDMYAIEMCKKTEV